MSAPSHVVVFDFDGTLLPKEYVSCFALMDRALSQAHREELAQIRNRYLPMLLLGKLAPKENAILVSNPAKVYIKSRLTISQIKEVLAGTKLRAGVIQTINFLHSQQIPVAIISYSFLQFIEFILKENGVRHLISKIYSPHLVIKNGLVCSYLPETFVYHYNKGLFSRNFAKEHKVLYRNILAVGDSYTDYRLGHLRENRLGIVEDQVEKEKNKKFFGEIIITKTFDPVLEWLKRKINT